MQPEDDSTVPDPAAEGDIAHQLADLREELHVAGLKAKAITAEYGRKIKFTIREAAFLCECSEGTIKNAIATGELKRGSSGYITRENLEQWYGCDPVQQYIRQAVIFLTGVSQLDDQARAERKTDRPGAEGDSASAA
jgi:hypothetical protein